MTLLLPKIKLESLSNTELKIYHNLDTQPYGELLAKQVASKLKEPKYEGWGLFHSHRDYCGLGLFVFDAVFTLGSVYDGIALHPTVAEFEDETDFVKWLAAENEQSMALYGEKFNNQVISKIRLEWFLEERYSPAWGDYCAYLREK